MGNSDSTNTLGHGDTELYVYFHFEKLIEKCYDPHAHPDKLGTKKHQVTYSNENKLVEDSQLNSDLLD